MSYLAIARKWRPGRFEDLIGQSHVVQTLQNALIHDRVSHAYLFSGARGVGKTSVARIFAKALRCPNVKEGIPCDSCEECLSISESRSVDVIEIDGASNNGVEAVRGIRENVAYGASSGSYKVYIIDEVHMLSLSAFNALLKTLEEPPAHVVFLFATTESQKIPVTILSRCQRFEFRRLTSLEISENIQKILSGEQVTATEEAVRIIASHSDGSLRDAQSLLDQVLSYYGSETNLNLSEEKVVAALGVSDSNSIREFIKAIIESQTKTLMEIIQEVYLSGSDLKHFTHRCLEEVRLFYLVKLKKEANDTLHADDLEITTAHLDTLNDLADKTSVIQIERMAQILGKAHSQLTFSSLPRFILEMAAVRMCQLKDLAKIEEFLQNPTAIQPAQITAPPKAAAAPETSETPPVKKKPLSPPTVLKPRENSPPPPPQFDEPQNLGPPPEYMNTSPTPPQRPMGKSWEGLVNEVMKKRPMVGALLAHANFKLEKEKDGQKVMLAFPSGSFYEKQAEEAQNREDIVAQLKAYFGPNTTLVLNNELEKTHSSLEQQREETDANERKEAREHPEVLKVKEALGADLIDVALD